MLPEARQTKSTQYKDELNGSSFLFVGNLEIKTTKQITGNNL
jgi:hypothetical protein